MSAGLAALANSLRGTMDAAGIAAEAVAERPEVEATFAGSRLAKAILAAELASRYSSHALQEWTLNTQPYGRLTLGLDAAALEYYGIHADRLGLAQWATLAALSSRPDLGGDEIALAEARDALISGLGNLGLVDAAGATAATQSAPLLAQAAFAPSPYTSTYLSLAGSQLAEREAQLAGSATPLVVTTSLDGELQLQALCAAQTALARAQSGLALPAMPTLDGGACPAAEFLDPAQAVGEADLAVAVWDVERSELLAYFTSARGASDDEADGEVGTAVLPFVYLTAFARGYTPGTMVLDVAQPVTPSPGGPLNADKPRWPVPRPDAGRTGPA